MKTKIIYISGNELFEMTDIRAAFEEVRSTLGLDKDTILFGVPVDCDDAMDAKQNDVVTETQPICESVVIEPEPIIITNSEILPPIAEHDEPEIDTTPEITAEVYTEPVVDTEQVEEDTAKVIPILSVLATKPEEAAPQNTTEEIIVDAPVTEPVEDAEQPEIIIDQATEIIDNDVTEEVIVDEADASEVIVAEAVDAPAPDEFIDTEHDISQIAPEIKDTDNVEAISIGDMINDDVPVAETKKTLEELLESMKPLREEANQTPVVEDTADDSADDFVVMDTDDTDATLAQLASEFAENEDKIVAAPKPEAHGKIGKLKNILPFKKAKRDDGGLMGDLFGWAGIAANDDDFAIPGFFSAGGQKK